MTSRPGTSLLEVLIAFAIMALVLAALLPGQARLLGRAQDGAERLAAHDYALSILDAAGLDEPLVPGEHASAQGDWRIVLRVSEEAIREVPLHRIAVLIEDASGRPLASAETLRAVR